MAGRAEPGQATGGTLMQILTVAIFRSWRGLECSAAPGLPGPEKHTRWEKECQTQVRANSTAQPSHAHGEDDDRRRAVAPRADSGTGGRWSRKARMV